jgi:RNA polymerase sigma-70 factor (ECF subfamily)
VKQDAATFERQRSHLRSIAYRMLGEMASAEDVVQEAWLRWQRADEPVEDPRVWLSAVTVRLSLDALRSARRRREEYVGPWLPEPLAPPDIEALAADASVHAELASDLSLALLYVLERLSPEERAALILHDAFDCDYDEIARTLGKSDVACRKLVSRARERVRLGRRRYEVSDEAHRELLESFARASASADPGALAALLSPDVVAYTDGGGRVIAARKPVRGRRAVARFITGVARRFYDERAHVVMTTVSGRPGMLVCSSSQILTALSVETDGQRITAIYAVRNPEKLARFARVEVQVGGETVKEVAD